MISYIARNIGRMTLYTVFLGSIAALVAVIALKESVDYVAEYYQPALVTLPESLTTDTWGIFDVDTGQVLKGNNIETPRPIASVTKLFAADAVLRSAKKDRSYVVEHYDVIGLGRAGKLELGEEVTLYDLLFPLLIESSNDAGEAIGRHLGEEYRLSIESLKETLSLRNTTIQDATGLSPRDVSTVIDLSQFYAYLKRTQPHILDITQLHMYVLDDKGYLNNNPAREYANFIGGKHGYTDEAGRTFVGSFRISGTKEVGIVLLGSSDLRKDLNTILTYGSNLMGVPQHTSAIMTP